MVAMRDHDNGPCRLLVLRPLDQAREAP
jgi:hypothetical protein